MTFDFQHFLKNISPSDISYIIIEDGSHTLIDGCGDLDLQYFKLKVVLQVSGLSKKSYLHW